MPRKRLPPRLQLRKRAGRDPVYVIRDGDDERSTGFGPDRSGEAASALSRYIAEKNASPDGVYTPDNIAVSTVLAIYATDEAPHKADPARIGYAIKALATFWGDLPVSAVKTATCRRYAKERDVSNGTVRRELGTLRAALNYCRKEGRLTAAPEVWLPEKPEPKDRWLTRSEAARLLRAARNRDYTHLTRFILLGLYTGTRKDAILRLQWLPNIKGGYIDLETGEMFRAGIGERQTNKRRPAIRVVSRLKMHIEGWRADSRQYVVEWQGQPVKSIKNAWKTVCKDAGIEDATPHTLRHTSITWAMQRGAKIEDAAGYFGVSIEVLQRVYWHHHPDCQSTVHDAFAGGFRG